MCGDLHGCPGRKVHANLPQHPVENQHLLTFRPSPLKAVHGHIADDRRHRSATEGTRCHVQVYLADDIRDIDAFVRNGLLDVPHQTLSQLVQCGGTDAGTAEKEPDADRDQEKRKEDA